MYIQAGCLDSVMHGLCPLLVLLETPWLPVVFVFLDHPAISTGKHLVEIRCQWTKLVQLDLIVWVGVPVHWDDVWQVPHDDGFELSICSFICT